VGVTASSNVFINGIAAHRQGDAWAQHCCDTCHTGVVATGSSTVFINGKPATRIGDQINCGSVLAKGSNNVFIGG
jgi:uncharacterized Zn-binding protein involved in type VI secretion